MKNTIEIDKSKLAHAIGFAMGVAQLCPENTPLGKALEVLVERLKDLEIVELKNE